MPYTRYSGSAIDDVFILKNGAGAVTRSVADILYFKSNAKNVWLLKCLRSSGSRGDFFCFCILCLIPFEIWLRPQYPQRWFVRKQECSSEIKRTQKFS